VGGQLPANERVLVALFGRHTVDEERVQDEPKSKVIARKVPNELFAIRLRRRRDLGSAIRWNVVKRKEVKNTIECFEKKKRKLLSRSN
jgi:hypothetical protein|tara:strand:- start:404 stop:667 length:264 start_codon:yes stop_codon:yes gene_type:complete